MRHSLLHVHKVIDQKVRTLTFVYQIHNLQDRYEDYLYFVNTHVA